MVSIGWPASTRHTPPTPPATSCFAEVNRAREELPSSGAVVMMMVGWEWKAAGGDGKCLTLPREML